MIADATEYDDRPPARKINIPVSADALIRVARGFSCVFWGIPLSLLLFSGALDVRLFAHIRMPA